MLHVKSSHLVCEVLVPGQLLPSPKEAITVGDSLPKYLLVRNVSKSLKEAVAAPIWVQSTIATRPDYYVVDSMVYNQKSIACNVWNNVKKWLNAMTTQLTLVVLITPTTIHRNNKTNMFYVPSLSCHVHLVSLDIAIHLSPFSWHVHLTSSGLNIRGKLPKEKGKTDWGRSPDQQRLRDTKALSSPDLHRG